MTFGNDLLNGAVVLSVGGPRNSGRRTFYDQELRPILEEAFPQNTFRFLGAACEPIPHPLAEDRGEWDLEPIPALYKAWGHYVLLWKRILECLAAGEIPVTLGNGLDVALNACAACMSEEEILAVLGVHHSMVKELKKAGYLVPPYYIIPPQPDVDTICMRHRRVGERDIVVRFVNNEQTVMKHYYDPNTGQHVPLRLATSWSLAKKKSEIKQYVGGAFEKAKAA
ncbi:MAG: hypothetical protein KGI41_02675 [Patescibacteria group bacterium]|nr:hypothetical protein [Patescibacteria group bacterium]MDE1966120.1 hypothetical protein [Patescibacteria group bacterium]